MTRRSPRLHDPKFLAFVRQKACCVCDKPGPSEACHIRMGDEGMGKRSVGLQEKPDDRWCVPMCQDHHRIQHNMSEFGFWLNVKLDPFLIAQSLYFEFEGTGGKAKGPRKIKPRKPRGERAKIQSRGFR